MPSVAERKRNKKLARNRKFQETQAIADMAAAARPKLSHIVDERLPASAEPEKVVPIRTRSIMEESVDKLAEHGVTPGLIQSLKKNRIFTIGDLKGRSNDEILNFEGFGPARVARIKLAYRSLGIE